MALQLTPALKAHMAEHFGLKPEDPDLKYHKVIGYKLLSGQLTPAKLQELTGKSATPVPAPKPAATPAPTVPVVDGPNTNKGGSVPAPRPMPQRNPGVDIDALVEKSVANVLAKMGHGAPSVGLTPEAVFSKSAATQVRLKSASESYSGNKRAAHYPDKCGYKGNGTNHVLAGQRATHGQTPLDHPSDRDKAVSQAYLKWSLKQAASQGPAPAWAKMTDHDTDLLMWSMHNEPWTGLLKGDDADTGAIKVNRRKMTDFEVKALLDDSTSGGIEAAPIAFDDAIVLIPVLYGELFPLVNVVNVARGRRMKGAAMSNPTFTSGTAEGTAITPFTTTGFVSAFDTTIFPAVAAMEIGLDFEEDSPVDMGGQIIEQYGLKALEWLDRVIAVGDGTTEPTGIFTSTSTVLVSSDSGPSGPVTIGDYEGLMFGMAKQFRNEAGSNPVWISNDTMYRRCRGIPVGPGDERRVMGMTHGDYSVMERPYKIQNNIANGKIAFANLRRYRMYRRLGMTVRIETTGKTLALANTRMIVLRMRYGGQIENGGAVSVVTDAQV